MASFADCVRLHCHARDTEIELWALCDDFAIAMSGCSVLMVM